MPPVPLAVRRAALAVFLLTLGCYTAGLCPGAYWLDSSEIAAASVLLGIAHPPGQPLALLLGKSVSLLPIGPAALRVGFAQALCASAAAALLTLLGARLGARVAQALGAAPEQIRPVPLALAAAGAALCTSLGYAVAFQAVRPEVYALHRLLALLMIWFALRHDEGDRRGLPLVGLVLGLALTNHHFLALIVALPLPILFRFREGRPLLRGIGVASMLGTLGLSVYAYLPLRALHHPLVNWGAPTTLSRIFWVISARAFQKSVKEPAPADADVVGALMEQVGPLSLLVGMVGLYLLLRQAQTRRLGAYLFAVVLLHAIGRAVLGFDVANPDAHGYLSPAGDVLALFACAAVGGLLCLDALRAPRRAWLAPALSTVLLISGAAWGVREPDRSLRSGFWDLDLVIGSWLAEAPPRARLLSSHFQTVFGLYYLMGVEGQRPDLEHWHPHFLKNPGHREDLLARFPHTSDLLEIFGPEADPGLRVPPLVLAAARRPTLIEYDLDAPRALVPMLAPAGLAEVIAPPVSFSAARAAAAQQTRDALVDAADLTEPETRRNLLWRSYIRLDLFCAQGDRPSFFSELARTRRLLQGAKSDEVDKLEHRCGGLLR